MQVFRTLLFRVFVPSSLGLSLLFTPSVMASIKRTPWGGTLPFDLDLSLTSSYTYNSNVNASGVNKEDDHIFRLSPGVTLSRNEGVYQAALSTGLTFQQSVNEGDLSSINPNLNATFSGPNRSGARLRGSANFSWVRTTQGDVVLNEVVGRDAYRLSSSLSYRYSPKFNFGLSPYFNFTDIDSDRGTDTFGAGTSLRGSYVYSEKLNFSLGTSYGYSTSFRDDPTETNSYSVFVGTDGELTDKLSGSIDLGWSYQDINGANLDDVLAPVISSSLGWSINEKTSASFRASTDLSVAVNNDAGQRYDFGVGISHRLATRWSLNGGVTYSLNFLEGRNNNNRTDHGITPRISLGATANEYLSFSAGLSYQINESTDADSDFQRILASLSANLSF